MTVIILIPLLLASIVLALLASGYYPKASQAEPVVQQSETPLLSKNSPFKILCYNVQFMAGKDYVFWFDAPDGNGPDTSPSLEAVRRTTAEVANIIIDEDPNFVFLQEVDDGAKRTHKEDQLKLLLDKLPATFHNHTSAFYWKSGFVPHPRILGRAGMKLSILSKHRIDSAKRHQLALTPNNLLAKHLGIKRAILEAHIPFKEGGELVLLNTHLEAFSKQSDTLQKQVQQVDTILSNLVVANVPWVIGGDFNLLAPQQYATLPSVQQRYYRPDSKLLA